ncbi:hypothetical protein SAMN04489740_0385 [Arthrobacter alpinus]|uniref:DUF6318 domain-containing protein n=1 Tax=Arthrobacter alpinus TaxID=656366 RepID=A0A1H5F092_9MICC|nr:DUF6318 family protein [Arthrobacter alpinus]SED96740.1 hypothetical protein SAMN04489740_0385 [Arthrobacter alpinus]
MMDSNTTTTHAITMQGHGQPHQHHHGDRHQHRHGDGYGYRSGRRGWVVPGVVVFLSVMLVLSGCTSSGDDPSPGVTSPAGTAGETTPPTTTTAVPPPTAAVYKPASDTGPAENVPKPVLPAKAQEFSKEGLIAFTEYWYSTLGYAFETGDPEPMMTISAPDCKTCSVMGKGVAAGHEGDKWIMGGKMVIGVPSTSFVPTADGSYQVITMARQEQVKYYKADKTLSKDLGVHVAEEDILIGSYQDGAWLAITVEHLDGPSPS